MTVTKRSIHLSYVTSGKPDFWRPRQDLNLRPLLYTHQMLRVTGGFEPPTAATKDGALPLSYVTHRVDRAPYEGLDGCTSRRVVSLPLYIVPGPRFELGTCGL